MESIAIFFIQSIIGGIAGNRSDSVTKSAFDRIIKRFKKIGNPQNHDIEKAIRKSYLLATVVVCNSILKEEKEKLNWKVYFSKNELIDWLNLVIKEYTKELHQIDKPDYSVSSLDSNFNPSLLLTNDQSKEEVKNVKSDLLKRVLEELKSSFGNVPEEVVDAISLTENDSSGVDKHYWFDLVCAFFAEELKENSRLRSIFESQILADIQNSGLPIGFEQFEEKVNLFGLNATNFFREIKESISIQTEGIEKIEMQLKEIKSYFLENLDNKEIFDKRLKIAQKYTGLENRRSQDSHFKRVTSTNLIGREKQKEEIDLFISENDSGIILITSPAGFGKTSLLGNWVKEKENKNIYIARHFFHVDDLSSSSAYTNILLQLFGYYQIEGEIIPNRIERLRDIIIGLIEERGSKEDQPLIIVFDALDEADPFIKYFFEEKLPKGVFIIASIRTNANYEIPTSHKSWTPSEKLIKLGALNIQDIINWVTNLQLPIKNIESFSKSCLQRTNGFPLYLKFLFDELLNIPTFDSQLLEDKLIYAPISFEAYVKTQFNLLSSKIELKSSKELQSLFALLTVVVGPISATDIENVLGLSRWDLEDLPWSIVRWFNIVESNKEKNFAFSHPLLATVFEELLGKQAKKTEQLLLSYCENWKSEKSRFVYLYYIPQLLKINQFDKAVEIVSQNKDWLYYKRSFFRNDKSTLDDIDKIVKYIKIHDVEKPVLNIIKVFSVREVIFNRILQYSLIDIRILVFTNRLNEAMDIVNLQPTLRKKLEYLLEVFIAISELNDSTEKIEESILDILVNSEFIEKISGNLAFIFNKISNDYPIFCKKIAEYVYPIVLKNLSGRELCDSLCFIKSYLDNPIRHELRIILTDTVDKLEDKDGYVFDNLDLLAKGGYLNLKSIFDKILNRDEEDRLFLIAKIASTTSEPDQSQFTLELFEYLWNNFRNEQIHKTEELNTNSPEICLSTALNLIKLGKTEPILRINEYNEKNKKIFAIDKIIEQLSKYGHIEKSLELLTFINDDIGKNHSQAVIACNAILNKVEGNWNEQIESSLLFILNLKSENNDLLDSQKADIVKIICETFKNNIPQYISEILVATTKSIQNSYTIFNTISHISSTNVRTLIGGIVLQIKETEELYVDNLGSIASEFYRLGFTEKAKKFEILYQTRRESYKLYEQMKLTQLSELSLFLKELSYETLSESILEFGFSLAKIPSDPNYLKMSEIENLATTLMAADKEELAKELDDKEYYFGAGLHLLGLINPRKAIKLIVQKLQTDDINLSLYYGLIGNLKANLNGIEDSDLTSSLSIIEKKIDESAYTSKLLTFFLSSAQNESAEVIESKLNLIAFNDLFSKKEDTLNLFIESLITNGYFDFALHIIEETEDLNLDGIPEHSINLLKNSNEDETALKILYLLKIDKNRIIEKSEIIDAFNNFEEINQLPILIRIVNFLRNFSTQMKDKREIIEILQIVLNILAWEDIHFHEVAILFDNKVEKTNVKISFQKFYFKTKLHKEVPNFVKAYYGFLKGKKAYLNSNFIEAISFFSEAIKLSNHYSDAYKFCRGLAYLLSNQLKEAKDNFNSIEVPFIKDYAEGRLLRVYLYEGDFNAFEKLVNSFKDTDYESYLSWIVILNLHQEKWEEFLKNTNDYLTLLNEDETNKNHYENGLIQAYLALYFLKHKNQSEYINSLNKLKEHFDSEKFRPRKYHLSMLLNLLNYSEPLTELFNFENMLNEAFKTKDNLWGLNAYENTINDAKIFIHLELNSKNAANIINELKISLNNSIPIKVKRKKEKSKKDDLKINNSFLNSFLLNSDFLSEGTVLQISSKNLFGEDIWVYIKLKMSHILRLRDIMQSGENFIPSNYGEVISAGKGKPPIELKYKLRVEYEMVDIPFSNPLNRFESSW